MKDKERFKLFLGEDFYPIGGHDDFAGYFDSIQEAKEFCEKEHPENECMWAQIVFKDIVICRGDIDFYPKKPWEWRNEKNPLPPQND